MHLGTYIQTPEIKCEHGEVRLVNGETDSEGALQFCSHGSWGAVCNTHEYWSPNNARVVCHQLGFYGECEIMIGIAMVSSNFPSSHLLIMCY